VNGTEPDPCGRWQLMLHGFIDGELDAAHSLEFEQHLATCPQCAEQLERFVALKKVVSQKGVRWRAPDHVRAQVLAAITREAVRQARPTVSPWVKTFALVRQWLFVPSLAALAASLFLVLGPIQNQASIPDEVVAGHVRSQLANHLTDVATSDQHTVKPWFNGKIDFSPPVVDLAPQGFPLVGGRVDYVNGRVVAALVYRRRGHLINLFIWPAPPGATSATTRDGYSVENWSKDGLTFWAVSDAAADEISGFREAFIEQTAK
jgi:anti-sigma factor RsiW